MSEVIAAVLDLIKDYGPYVAGGIGALWTVRRQNIAHHNKLEAIREKTQNEIKALAADMESQREKDNLESQKTIREYLGEERRENQLVLKKNEELTQTLVTERELRTAAEVQAEERSKQITVLIAQEKYKTDRLLEKTEAEAVERTKREMLEKENAELRGRVNELEQKVKQIPVMESEIETLREQGKTMQAQIDALIAERAQKEKEIDQLKAAVNEAA